MQYYSYMMKNLILKLREMTTYIDIKSMDKYLTINDEGFNKINDLSVSLYNYKFSGNKPKVSVFFNTELYPVITNIVIIKKGFKKIKCIKISQTDLFDLIKRLENTMI